jgi:CubicO group peptidase (beta-lactamase class C family)
MGEGLHIGAQLHVVVGGETAGSLALGEARRGVPMTSRTLMPWLSCTKVITAMAVAQQWERGEVDLDDPVRAHIPAFTGGGRDAITVRHLLTHTAGLRSADGGAPPGRIETWDEAVARAVATAPEPGWEPGRRAGYHARGTFLLLGEIVRLLDGRPFDRYVKEEILAPLGMGDSWLALTAEQYRDYGERMGVMYDTSGAGPRPVPGMEGPDAYRRCVPGGSGVGPASDLASIAQLLLDEGRAGAAQVLSPQAVEAMTARHRVGLVDETFRASVDWGLGIMANSWYHRRRPAPYGYGNHASNRAVGHGGAQSSLVMADPEYGVALALVCNGMPGEVVNHRRTQPVIDAVYEDLGLA